MSQNRHKISIPGHNHGVATFVARSLALGGLSARDTSTPQTEVVMTRLEWPTIERPAPEEEMGLGTSDWSPDREPSDIGSHRQARSIRELAIGPSQHVFSRTQLTPF
jgi:hypothetical protein